MHKDSDKFSFIDEISNDIFYGLNEDFFFKKKKKTKKQQTYENY